MATLQFSVTVQNAELDAIETAIGTAPTLEIRAGTMPANCAASDSSTTLLVSMTLPSDWMAAASSGSKAKSGTWQDTAADASGNASFFRIKASGTCHIQGDVTASGGGGAMELGQSSVAIVSGQPVTVNTFTLTAGNS